MTTFVPSLSPRERRAFSLLVASEIKLAWRRPIGLAVAIGVPLVLLVIFGSIPATTRPQAALGGISFFNLYAPSLLMLVLIVVGLMSIPQELAGYREHGVLRRMSTTPAHPSWLLGAQVAVSVIFAAIGIAILIGVGKLVFGLTLPNTLGGCLVSLASLVLTLAAILGLGLCAAARARSSRAAQAMTALMFYPLMFFSGIYVPLESIHSQAIHLIAKLTPTGAGFNAVHAAFTGHSPGAAPLLVLAGWTIICSVAAGRLFVWE